MDPISRRTWCRWIRGASPTSTSAVQASTATTIYGPSEPTELPAATAKTQMSRRGPSNDGKENARVHPDRAGGDALRPVAGRECGGAIGGERGGNTQSARGDGRDRYVSSRSPRAGGDPQSDLRGESEERGRHRRAPRGQHGAGHPAAQIITFLPQGLSSGSRLHVEMAGRRFLITVDPLTGRVATRRADP